MKNSAYNAVAVDTRDMLNTTKTLSEALAKTPGLKLRESGGVGSDINLMLDGFSGKHVKVFIDGVPQEGVGSSFGLNNIPVSFADRIEVYKGVVPVNFGTDAIGGVINIVTATPQILYCDPYSEGLGFADIAFILPNTDVDGNELDTDKLHYNLFFDDDIATFTPDVYLGLKEEMTDIPYDFTDNWDFQIYMDGIVREILFYETDIEKVGVRSTYTSDEGESADSDIAWYYFTPTNISNIEPDNTDIKVVYYTDVAGRRISRPANGLYLKTEVYGNGTSKTTKVMIK